MKKTILVILLAVITLPLFAQEEIGPPLPGERREKLEQLEKIKLIEVLEMDEETTLKFFARRSDHREVMRGYADKRNEILKELQLKVENSSDEGSYNALINKVLEYEDKIVAERKRFITSLDDILTTEQIAGMMVFELEFKNKLREHLMRRRGGGGPKR